MGTLLRVFVWKNPLATCYFFKMAAILDEYLADTEPYVEFHSSDVTTVHCLRSDTHSISPVNDGGSLDLFIHFVFYIHLFNSFLC
jgi:hypothetical protein